MWDGERLGLSVSTEYRPWHQLLPKEAEYHLGIYLKSVVDDNLNLTSVMTLAVTCFSVKKTFLYILPFLLSIRLFIIYVN